MNMRPLLAITMGDVNGVGPEVLAKALARPEPWLVCTPLVIGNAAVLAAAGASVAGAPVPVVVAGPEEAALDPGAVAVLEPGPVPPPVRPGVLDPEAGRAAVAWIKHAVALALAGKVQGMVTCPISKECIHRAGFHYIGHTELVAEMTGSPDYRMCLFAGKLRAVHITSHLSLRDAIDAVRSERIMTSIRIADTALRRLGIAPPRIGVAGLNPHAGEAGAFGREEMEEIAPAVSACRAEGIHCSGPFPPDTIFRRMADGEFDIVISMYHDQGHIPLKLVAMDEGVNVTLGISIVRTSVDHGTAYDIAGKGLAREASLCAAIDLAARLSAPADLAATQAAQ